MGMLQSHADLAPRLQGSGSACAEDARRLAYLRDQHGATIFDLESDIAGRGPWDDSDLELIIETMAQTRREFGLSPTMDDAILAETLRAHPIFGPSRLSHSERFAGATFHFHELCSRIFGEYPHYHDPDTGSPEWRGALAAYVFFLRLSDASRHLDRMAEAAAERISGQVRTTLANVSESAQIFAQAAE